MKEATGVTCELCDSPAKMYCDSDRARLCYRCDAKVHGANFLVAKHSRTLLCHHCQSPTPWAASGHALPPSLSLCLPCLSLSSPASPPSVAQIGTSGINNHHGDNEEEMIDGGNYVSEGEEDDEIDDVSGSDNDDDDDSDNQVVPWKSSPPRAPRESGNVNDNNNNNYDDNDDEEEGDGDVDGGMNYSVVSRLKRKRDMAFLNSNTCGSSSSNSNRNFDDILRL